MVSKNCAACGKEFWFYPSRKTAETCSRECRTLYKYQRASEKVRKMSDVECAWFAGMFDGEGSIVQTQRKRTPEGSFRIQITNTVIEVLEQAEKFTGVGRVNVQYRKNQNPRHSVAYTWTVAAGPALEILRQIRPWLIVKAERADAVLEGRSFERQGRWDHLYS
jgi:hypothetical protein